MGVPQSRTNEIDKYLSKDVLEKLFAEGYSANYIAKKYFYPDFTTTAGVVINRAKKFNISTHSIKSALNLRSVIDRRRNTFYEKYGVFSASEIDFVKTKKIDSAMKKYGVTNVFQAEEIKQKSRKTCIEKYGTPNVGTLSVAPGRISKHHQKVERILDHLNIKYRSEVTKEFFKFNIDLGKEYCPIPDIVLTDYPIIIECFGDLWHAHPDIYEDDHIIIKYKGPESAKSIRAFDAIRNKHLESFGFKVVIIWESDFKNSEKYVIDKILTEIQNCNMANK